jgi:sugar fermentation stimulation protein A
MEDVTDFAPNDMTHPAFGAALRQAAAAGVQIVAVNCRVAPDKLEILDRIPVIL